VTAGPRCVQRPSRRHEAVAGLLLLVATLTAALPASAAPKWVEADERFRRGVQLYNETNFSAALVEFQRAYDIDPKYQVLYNIAETYYQLQDYANALKTYQRYLQEGGNKIAAKRRKDVETEIAKLTKRVATLTITTSEPGATVSVDDVVVGKTPLEPLSVSAGRRKITATLAGRIPVTETVDLAGGDQKTLQLVIAALPAPLVAKPEPKPTPSIVPQVISWSATGALAAGAVVTGVLALGASSDLEQGARQVPRGRRRPGERPRQSLQPRPSRPTSDRHVGRGRCPLRLLHGRLGHGLRRSCQEPAAAAARVMVLPGSVAVEGTF
jgi:hypothetical protein